MEQKLIKSRERVSKHGEVFTPEHIVKDMIALICDKDWSDIRGITLEPTCGNGNFVVEVVRKKLSLGMSLYNSLNTTFGMDIMVDNIDECRIRLIDICKEKLDVGSELFFSCVCVIVNNIFVVKDSLEYIRSKQLEDKKFFELDTTQYLPKSNNLFEEESQVLNEEEQDKIKEEAKEYAKI